MGNEPKSLKQSALRVFQRLCIHCVPHADRGEEHVIEILGRKIRYRLTVFDWDSPWEVRMGGHDNSWECALTVWTLQVGERSHLVGEVRSFSGCVEAFNADCVAVSLATP